MARRARIHYSPLKTSLVNLPLSLYGGLLQANVRPQGLGVHLKPTKPNPSKDTSTLKYKDGVYLGWTGMASSSSLAHWSSTASAASRGEVVETVEMDPQLGALLGFGFSDGDIVEIGLLHDLQPATSVATEPASEDDWEILELHASYVEENLLSQVRCASVGQDICVWVLGRTVVRMRVVSTSATKGNAVLLTTNTEVSIAPRTRSGQRKGNKGEATEVPPSRTSAKKPKKGVLRIIPSKHFTFQSAVELPYLIPSRPSSPSAPHESTSPTQIPIHLNPASAIVTSVPPAPKHPTNGTENIPSHPSSTSSSTPTPSSPELNSRMHLPLTKPIGFASYRTFESISSTTSFGPVPQWGRDTKLIAPVLLERLIPPFENPKDNSSGKAKDLAEREQERERILHRAGADELIAKAEKEKENGEQNQDIPGIVRVWLMPAAGIPDREVVLFFPEGEEMSQGGLKDWDLVMASYIPSAQSIATSQPFYELQHVSVAPIHNPVGVDSTLKTCHQYLRNYLLLQSGVRGLGRVDRFGAILLHGRAGYGKTLIANAVAEMLSNDTFWFCYVHYINLAAPDYTTISPLTLKSKLETIINEAAWHKPSVLILDNFDKVCKSEEEHAPSYRTRQISEIVARLFDPSNNNPLLRPTEPNGIVVIATAASLNSVHPTAMQKHVFGRKINIGTCSKEQRKAILERYITTRIENGDVKLSENEPLNYSAIAMTTEGYSPNDLIDLIGRSMHIAAVRIAKDDNNQSDAPLELMLEDFEVAHKGFTPLSLRDITLTKSEVSWSDVGGLSEVKRIIRETLEWPTKYAAIFAKSPLRLRSGLLLYGYPGCGKTLLASAVAKECGLNFISVKGPEILNKYIGASEQSVRDLFDRATAAKPCVLFFDEFDSIAPRRGHDSTGVTDRVVNQLLTQMDGAEGLDGVYVLAATSRPDLLDPALLRPGRLDKSILCDMPNLVERREILEAVSRNFSVEDIAVFEEIAAATDGYSGADMQALIYNAQLEGVHERISMSKGHLGSISNATNIEDNEVEFVEFGGDEQEDLKPKSLAEREALKKRITLIATADRRREEEKEHYMAKTESQAKALQEHKVTRAHLLKALKTTQPSVPVSERLRLQRIYEHFISAREGGMPHPPQGGEGVGLRVSMA